MELDKNGKANYLLTTFQKHNENKKNGGDEIVKVILSIVSVLLTVLATLETLRPHKPLLCEQPVIYFLNLAPYFLLLLCVGFCLYYLNYSLRTYHSNMAGLVNEALEKTSDFESAYTYLQKNPTFLVPKLYQKSFIIIFSLFILGIVFTILRII